MTDNSMLISIKEDIAKLNTNVKNIFVQLDKQDSKQGCDDRAIQNVQIVLAKIDTKIDASFATINEKLADHDERLNKIECAPAKAWWVVLSTALGALVMFAITKLFGGK